MEEVLTVGADHRDVLYHDVNISLRYFGFGGVYLQLVMVIEMCSIIVSMYHCLTELESTCRKSLYLKMVVEICCVIVSTYHSLGRNLTISFLLGLCSRSVD